MGVTILLAESSPFERGVLTELLQATGDIRVVGQATGCREALSLAGVLKPDLVVMDLGLTREQGARAVEEVLATLATPVLLLSGSEPERSSTAPSPTAPPREILRRPARLEGSALPRFATRLRERARLLAARRITPVPFLPCERAPDRRPKTILAIGASTGGPKGVMTILKALPRDFGATVFVIQHIAEGCARGFAQWLDDECLLAVGLAADGEPIRPGEVVVAPNGHHLTVSQGRLYLKPEPPVHCCRPSIDVFFASLAQSSCRHVVAVLLSGMGKDGAQGLLGIKQQGGFTMVQDEQSSAIFGMPKAALKLGAADRVVPITGMPAALEELFQRTGSIDPSEAI